MHVRLVLTLTLFALIASAPLAAQTLGARIRPVEDRVTEVSGFVLPVQTSAAGFVLEVYEVAGTERRLIDRQVVEKFTAAGEFTVTLRLPARANQRVELTHNGSAVSGGVVTVTALPPPAVTLQRVLPGDRAIAGFLLPPPKSADGFVVEVRANGTLIERRSFDRFDAATGAFSVPLAAPLMSDATISVLGNGLPAMPQRVPAFDIIPVLRPSLKDGNREVRGLLRDRTAVSSIRVGVLRSPLEHQTDSKRFVQSKTTTEINADGEWSVTLEEPLVAGQVVVAEAFTAAGQGAEASDGVTVVDPGSWGRARAYFAGGVIFSKSNGDFSQQDLTLAFAIDKGWLQKPDFKPGLEEGELPREAG